MVGKHNSEGRAHGTCDVEGEHKIAQTLAPMSLRSDVGDKHIGGGMKKRKPYPLKKPYYQKRPERGCYSVGQASKGKKEGAADHKPFFGDSRETSTDKRSENQRRNGEAPYEHADLNLLGPQARKIDRKSRNKDIDDEAKGKLRATHEKEIAREYLP